MGFVAALVALLASTEPVLCVDAEATMADDIVDAVRVRMEGRPIRVARCDSEQGSATWRVTVRSAGDDVLALAIEGDVTWNSELDVHEMRAGEVSRLVALHVVEAVRESVSAVAPRVAPAEETTAEPVAAAGAVAIEAHAGPVLLADPFGVAAQAQLAGKWQRATMSFVGTLALRTMASAERLGVTASGGELHLELAGRKRWWDLVELGLHLRGRVTRIGISGTNGNVRNGARAYVDYGAAVSGLMWLWRGERLAVGGIVQATVWARPHWLSVEGQELLRQARIDVFLGPVLELRL